MDARPPGERQVPLYPSQGKCAYLGDVGIATGCQLGWLLPGGLAGSARILAGLFKLYLNGKIGRVDLVLFVLVGLGLENDDYEARGQAHVCSAVSNSKKPSMSLCY
eukprot:TRINITY_DN11822_c1_g1_i2.p4 TRINITY_DN11822_c1_g1~~TRINITY_DN11822_c1_g1_i2.p4  ORF type:complete len:106 (-),score=0.18 TRINITY_DN11822_c1_g1_i2:1239-1556(-)